jgi:hypothetical protein
VRRIEMELGKELIKKLLDEYSADELVWAVVQVGSTVKGYADEHSDVDLKVVAAISDDGSIIAAVTGNASGYWAYFYAYDGNLLGNASQLDALSDKISMSADGTTVAVGGAPESPDSLYVFETPFPVGGEIQPSNTLELIVHHVQLVAPYLLASMLAVATLIAFVARTRRRQHTVTSFLFLNSFFSARI